MDDKLLSFIQAAEQHRAYLTWVATRTTRSIEEAEDIVQQALLKAFRNLAGFQGNAQMRTWLHVIVQNTAREYLRSQRRQPPLQSEFVRPDEEDNTLRDIPDPRRNPEEVFEFREMETILRAEIDALSPLCKCALELCALGELPHLAAAKAMNTSVANVKSRVFRAKKELKRAIGQRVDWLMEVEASDRVVSLAQSSKSARFKQ